MEADFSGYATKNNLKCSDGRTIMADAFKHNDGLIVPLVWQHQHSDPVNILGHAKLENRSDGVYAYGFFNDTPQGGNAKTLVQHKDVVALSIYANQLKQNGQNVIHGDIKELSLVLSGANPGAFIDNINLAHGDESVVLDDEAIIYTGLELQHDDVTEGETVSAEVEESQPPTDEVVEPVEVSVEQSVEAVFESLTDEQRAVVYSLIGEALKDGVVQHAATTQQDPTIKDVFDSLDEEQQTVAFYLIGEALNGDVVKHAATATPTLTQEKTVEDVFNTFTEEQKTVVYYLIGEALDSVSATTPEMPMAVQHASAPGPVSTATLDDLPDSEFAYIEPGGFKDGSGKTVPRAKRHFPIMDAAHVRSALARASQSPFGKLALPSIHKAAVKFKIEVSPTDTASHEDSTDTNTLTHQEGSEMPNVFEQNGVTTSNATLTHAQIKTIIDDAQECGSFKTSFLAHAQDYGITNIDLLFPDATLSGNVPDVISRRQEWVAAVLSGAKHSPFARIKSIIADLTAEEARAKGYVKGNLKKNEIINLLRRITTPTTIYKKQKLDRDDIIDITDLDVVLWLKAEMRVMLDEELARAILIGDGREPDDEDKIDETHIRPIAFDVDMYNTTITLQANLAPAAVIEAVLRARTAYKGTGIPTFYTTYPVLVDLLLQKDTIGRRLYDTPADVAAALGVASIVTVEIMESNPAILGIVVNLTDYTIGADKGGAVSLFDNFDIDYNQLKYLIEVRVSGALTKPKSAVTILQTVGTVVNPLSPSYDGPTHSITLPTITGVVYTIGGSVVTGTIVLDETTDVMAAPALGYSFPHNIVRDWTFVYVPGI
jgi:hypothetical protein